MGLFDGYQFDQQNYGGQGILPPWLMRAMQAPQMGAGAMYSFPPMPGQGGVGPAMPEIPQGDSAPSPAVIQPPPGSSPPGGGGGSFFGMPLQGGGFADRIGQGLSNNALTLMALGGGIAQGGIGRGLQMAAPIAGYEREQASQREAQRSAMQYVAAQRDIPPELKRSLLSSPSLAQKYVEAKIKPESNADIAQYEYAKRQGFDGSFTDFLQRKRAGAGEYGMQPIYGVGPGGKAVVMQLGKGGVAIESKLPEGVTLSKEPIRIDAGTHTLLLDPITRQPSATVPKNVSETAAARESGEAQGQAQAALINSISSSERMLKIIAELKAHPGKNTAVGNLAGRVPASMLFGDAKDFNERIEQAKGGAFLEAFTDLKGGGAISETEGTKATQAKARLDRAKSVKDFDTALDDLADITIIGRENAKKKAAGAGRQTKPEIVSPAVSNLKQKYGLD